MLTGEFPQRERPFQAFKGQFVHAGIGIYLGATLPSANPDLRPLSGITQSTGGVRNGRISDVCLMSALGRKQTLG